MSTIKVIAGGMSSNALIEVSKCDVFVVKEMVLQLVVMSGFAKRTSILVVAIQVGHLKKRERNIGAYHIDRLILRNKVHSQ
jgi:hypothetical protein